MTQEKLKQFLDACFDAKRLIEKLPDLPDGMKPRQVHVLDAVNEIQKKQGFCRVSDISSYMNTTLPSITKLVQELEERNLLVKQADEKDKRVINLTLTEEGKEFVELRVTHFHGEWASRLPDLDDAVVDEFVHAITRMQETMPGIKGVKTMAKENKKEISFVEGPIFQSLIRFALPVLGALILQAAYGAVDLLVVGWFGDASSISAVGTGSNFMQMVTLIITSLAMGSTVMIGQHIGEGKPDKAGKTVGTSIVLFAIIGIAMTVILELFAGPIANILQVPAESFDKTVLYLRICSGGILIIIAYNVISSVLRGIGNANLPLLFVGIACAANIAGDLFFVGVLKLDVAGAALATVLAQLISVIASMGVLKKAICRLNSKRRLPHRP